MDRAVLEAQGLDRDVIVRRLNLADVSGVARGSAGRASYERKSVFPNRHAVKLHYAIRRLTAILKDAERREGSCGLEPERFIAQPIVTVKAWPSVACPDLYRDRA